MLHQLFTTLNNELLPIPTELPSRIHKSDSLKAIIFDIYGTLVISGTGDISIAQTIDRESELRKTLTQFSIPLPSAETRLIDSFFEIIQDDHTQSKAAGHPYPEVDILEIWKQFFQTKQLPEQDTPTLKQIAITFECAVNPVWPMPALVETLETLKSKDITLGIVSNAQFYTPIMLEAFTGKSLDQLGFDDSLSIWSYQERLGKPSVELFEKLTAQLATQGITPKQTLYVGNDMLNDIWTAHQAGLKTCLFAGDHRSLRLRKTDDRCKDLQPDFTITDLAQIKEIVF